MSVVRKLVRNVSVKGRLATAVAHKRELSATQNFEVKSPFQDIEIPKIQYTDLIFQNAHKWGDKIAVECGSTGRSYTYDKLRVGAENFGKALRKRLKLQVGDVVAIMMPNVPEYPMASLGIMKAGLAVTPINPIYTEDEVARQLIDSTAKAIITLGSFTKNAELAIQRLRKKLPIIGVTTQRGEALDEGVISFQELIQSNHEIEDIRIDDIPNLRALLPYSSGTTGLPKGVELTNNSLVSNLLQCTHEEIAIFEPAEGNHQDVTIAILPMFHIYGTTSSTWFLHFGMKTVTLPRFTPESYASSLITHKPGSLFVVPPIVIYLTVYPGVTREHLQSLHSINSGAAPLGALDEAKLREKAGKDIDILQGYGLSEAPVVTVNCRNKKKPAGSVGIPLPSTTCKVVSLDDPSESPLGPNTTGELYVRGPQVMRGYYNNPEATKNTFSGDWFKTGDMVYYNEEGYFFVTDRIKELIKVKGFQVAPAELEEIIRDFDGVADACVIGVPHDQYGEVPRAYVVPKKSKTIDIDNLEQYVTKKVASYKKLEGGIAIVDSVPKNASGKLLRRELKERYMNEKK